MTTTTPAPAYPPLPPATQLATPARRSPGLTVVLSFLPGLGHLYLGLYQRGMLFFAAFAASIWFGDQSDTGPLFPIFIWFFGLIDAYRQAQLINAGMLPDLSMGGPAVTLKRGRGNLGLGVFLTVLGAILLYNQFYPLDLTFLVDWWPLLLVVAGVYLLAKHALEVKRQREAERPPEAY
ncbi:MAG: DUF5668 domain-containing protein [Acidobacteriota bacterium]